MENKKVLVVAREVGVEGVRAETLSKRQLEIFNQALKEEQKKEWKSSMGKKLSFLVF